MLGLDLVLLCAIVKRRWFPPLAATGWLWRNGWDTVGLPLLPSVFILMIYGYVGVFFRIAFDDWRDERREQRASLDHG